MHGLIGTFVRSRFLTAAAVVIAASGVVVGGTAVAANAGATGSGNSDIYVSPTGDDHASGSLGHPVQTLAQAQQLVRARDQHLRANLTVHLAPGTYRMSSPLALTASDSGSDGHQVIWQGSGDTVISGGLRVTGWTPVPGQSDLWSAPAPAGLTNTRQLYVNGVRAARTSSAVPVTLTPTPTGYTASSDLLAHWRNPSDIEFVYTGGAQVFNAAVEGLGGWTEPRCPIASISGTTITMAQPCWDNSMKRVDFPNIPGRTVSMVGPGSLTNNAQPSAIENAYELLDQPGQWYLDRSAHRIYYMPRHGENLATADVEAPALQQLVTGAGTTQAPIHDIAFRGVRFEYATWLAPSSPEGFSEIQAGYTITGSTGYATEGLCTYVQGGTCPYGSWTQEPGNVAFQHAQRVEFSDDVFTHLGAAGLQLGDGSQDSIVRGDVFTDISGNGVEIGSVDQNLPTNSADVTRGNQITDNHLYALPVEFHGGVAIVNGYTQDDVISHNQIDHTAYSAISMGWGGWPDKIQQPATPNDSHDNQVTDNLIYDHMQVLDDGGGIYTQGLTGSSMATGEKVTGNVIHDQWGFGKAVYTDNGCTYETVSDNVMYGVSYDDVASRHTDYRDGLGNNDPTLVSDNWWEQGDPDSNNKGLVTQGNHIIASPSEAPASIVNAAGLEPAYRWVLGVSTAATSVPAAPMRVGTFATDGTIYATWNPSYVANGAPVTSYTVTATGGGHSVSTVISAADFASTAYARITGLTDGTSYTVSVAARNAVGLSEYSLPSAAVTPSAGGGQLPAAVTGVSTDPTANAVSVHWSPPTDTGSTPIIGYTVTVSDGRTITLTGRDVLTTQPAKHAMFRVIGGLRPNTSYTVTIATVTGSGTGPATSTEFTTTAS